MKLQWRPDEDLKLLAVVAVFVIVECIGIVQLTLRFSQMSIGDRLGGLACVIFIIPAIIAVFMYLWLRIARPRMCAQCNVPMRRLPRPYAGPYMQQCPKCGTRRSTGIRPGAVTRQGLGDDLLEETENERV